jgi:hypothetical protein
MTARSHSRTRRREKRRRAILVAKALAKAARRG